MSGLFSLGIDTSNYKTSVAVTDREGNILYNHQEFLVVKRGERGLRQSEALFQHVQRLPHILSEALANDEIRQNIGAVAVSSRPRPVEGSYMPVFTVGTGYGKTVASALNVPLYEFSHQEGHIEAVKHYSHMKDVDKLICFHFSGGTTEALLVDEKDHGFLVAGGSKDLAYGQVLDRVGVSMGLDFPCGEALDNIAVENENKGKMDKSMLSKIKVNDCYVNLSGIETQCQRSIGKCSGDELINLLFYRLAQSITEMTRQLAEKYKINNFIYAGGVSGSKFIRKFLACNLGSGINTEFGDPKLSSDNAVGTALLGGKKIWH